MRIPPLAVLWLLLLRMLASSRNVSPVDNEVALREYRVLRRLLLVGMALLAGVCLSMNVADPDLWGHVRYGRDLIDAGAIPATATHTFTAVGHPWINHELLAELALASVAQLGGDQGLLVFKLIWGWLLLGLMAAVARRHGVAWLTIGTTLLVVAAALGAFFPVRPQLLSYMWLGLILVVLDRAFTGWHDWLRSPAGTRWPGRQAWWLATLPLIVAVWTNSHGAFVAGVAILVTYLGGRCIEAIAYKRRAALIPCAVLIGTAGAATAATLLNPYGFRLHAWLWTSLTAPRPEVTEWVATNSTHAGFAPWVALLAISIAGWLYTRRERDWVQIFVWICIVVQSYLHVRHISLLAIVAGFWLPVHFDDVLRRFRPARGTLPVVRLSPLVRWPLAGLLCVSIAVLSVQLYDKTAHLPVYRHAYPVDALQYMADKQVSGRMVVSFNWAQYALDALSPDVKVAFDGRYDTCYPQDVVDHHFDFELGEHGGHRYRALESGPLDPRQALTHGDPNLILINREYTHAVSTVEQLASDPERPWVLLYQDHIAQLWGLASEFDNPASSQYLPANERLVSDHLSLTAVAWPALPRRGLDRAFARRGQPLVQLDHSTTSASN